MIYLYYGEDQFTLKEELERRRTDSSSEFDSGSFIRIEAAKAGFNIDEVLNAAQAFSMFGEKQLVLVTNLIERLSKGGQSESSPKPSTATRGAKGKAPKTQTPRERFLEFIPQAPATADLILLEQKVTKVDVIYKAIEKYGVVKEFVPPKERALQKWIEERAKQEKIKLGSNVAERLTQYLGSNLYALHNELLKLATYAGDNQTVTTEMVEKLTAQVSETSIFKLTEALSRRNLPEAIRQLNRLRNETTLNRAGFTRQIFVMICREIYNLLRIREMDAARRSDSEIASTLALHPFVVQKSRNLVRNFSAERLDTLYHRLAELDYADKTGRGDLATQLELLLADICNV
ncbi:MAG: DNA polymerase III subunit delta [Chloroflexi bacterium]|nr:DNA polymerase III subunit delta [Chloroflexota bacterium]